MSKINKGELLVKFHTSPNRSYMLSIKSDETELDKLMQHISVTTELERKKDITKVEFFSKLSVKTWER
jgi:hypothetical protein